MGDGEEREGPTGCHATIWDINVRITSIYECKMDWIGKICDGCIIAQSSVASEILDTVGGQNDRFRIST